MKRLKTVKPKRLPKLNSIANSGRSAAKTQRPRTARSAKTGSSFSPRGALGATSGY